MNKKILVLLKIFKGDLNPFDKCALENALSIEGAEVTVLSMSPLAYLSTLSNVTRLGCDAILLSDHLYALSDTIATSNILAEAIKKINPDLVFAGRQSIDGDTAQVPLMLSELLNYQLVNKVMNLENGIAYLRNGEQIQLNKKQIVTFEKFKLLRSPSIFSKSRDVKVITNDNLQLAKELIGQPGSKTMVINSRQNMEDRRFCKFIGFDELDGVIQKEKNNQLSVKEENKQTIPEIYFVGDIEDVAKKYTNKAIRLNIDGLSIDEIIELIIKKNPLLVIWEENDKYKEIACRVAIKMRTGLCADCTDFKYVNNKIIITRPALSGDVMADIVCTSIISMATVRKNIIEDGIAITIGKGALDNLDGIKKLADKYHAKIYCSRPLADMGKFAYEQQVGLTGITISPKVCICIGVSGAVQHIAGINKSKTIIAINIDKKEKIFDYADYGIVMDVNNIN